MDIKVFSPINVKPEDYRHRYPELERCPEFFSLSPKALIFVWWFSNQSSDLVLYEHDEYARVEEALKRSGFNPGKVERERILHLQFDSELAVAIKKMGSFDPGARFKSYLMVKKIFDQYQELVSQGPAAFKTTVKVGKGEGAVDVEETDYKEYVNVSAKIAGELPGLLTKLEEGFAVVNLAGEEVKEDESTALTDWQRKRAGE
jgi:hypothetical protein